MLCVCVCVAHPGHVWLWIRLRGSNFDHGVQSSAEWHTQRGGEKRGEGGEQSRQKYLQVCGTVLALSLFTCYPFFFFIFVSFQIDSLFAFEATNSEPETGRSDW